uniref:CDP-diacylglycerol--inositol 3-phosphatidyltransferase n=1 Tax=Gallus gallus TaxID=9031 RepID=A0A8V0X6Q3_CHICK
MGLYGALNGAQWVPMGLSMGPPHISPPPPSGYARVALSAVSVVLMPHSPLPAALCYALSAALDAVDGLAARWLNQGSRLGAMLDMLTDRCSLLCLQLNLALLYPSAAPLLQLSVCLDIASHWLHMHTWAGLRGGVGRLAASHWLRMHTWAGLSQWGGGVNGGGGARRNWGQPLVAQAEVGGA